MKRLLIATALLASLGAGAAQAQSLDTRHAYQQDRIAQGVRSGALTPGEAHRVEHQQRSIDRQEARMRDRHDGRLTYADRRALRYRENRASRHIYAAKHNGRAW